MKGIMTKMLVALTVMMLTVGIADAQQKHDYVDLGLPSGTLWATCNVGANSPEEYGGYFAWGETESGSLDPNTFSNLPKVLPSSNDAAAHNWGRGWCIPTYEQFCELLNKSYCSWTWTGKGYEVKSINNGKSIFFPAAGYRLLLMSDGEGEIGRYWTSSLSEDDSWPFFLFFNSDSHNMHKLPPLNSFSVRPVRRK